MEHYLTKVKQCSIKKTQIVIRNMLIFLCSLYSANCLSQKEGDFLLGLSSDVAVGKYNNFAPTLHLRYHLLDRFRVAPSFSYYLNKNEMKMQSFAFNFHYLFPQMASRLFPKFKNQSICFYPLAGFYITRVVGVKADCSSCSVGSVAYRDKSANNFGFDFGLGADYKLPVKAPFFKNTTAFFEIQYQLVESYNRPVFAFGLLYNLRKR